MIPCCACICTCVLTELASVANLTFVNQMLTLELAENALTLQSVLSVFTRKFERNAVFTKCHEPIRFGSRLKTDVFRTKALKKEVAPSKLV